MPGLFKFFFIGVIVWVIFTCVMGHENIPFWLWVIVLLVVGIIAEGFET